MPNHGQLPNLDHLSDESTALIEAHQAMRSHLFMLLEDTKDVWEVIPESKQGKSNWSMQSSVVEILNYELKLLNSVLDEPYEYLDDDLSYDEFVVEQERISEILISCLSDECEKEGFVMMSNHHEEGPSFHWVMQRTIMHGIYHTGGISVLRHLLGLDRANYENWPEMVDSVFNSTLISDVVSHHSE